MPLIVNPPQYALNLGGMATASCDLLRSRGKFTARKNAAAGTDIYNVHPLRGGTVCS